jgi:DNA-binding SARP family transcriptional activator/Tfp pilus assembly protein PilF
MRIQVLGPVGAWHHGVPVDLGPPRQRGLLGLLALAGGRPMPRAELVEALWQCEPPVSAINMIQSHVKRLRRALEPERLRYQSSTVLPAVGDGYALRVPAGAVDALVFRDLVSTAVAAQREGRAEPAATMLAEAIGLWQGSPLADVALLADHPKVTALFAERNSVLVGYAQARGALGEWAQTVSVLQEATTAQPLDEAAHAWLIRAYHVLGRRADAFALYHQIRRRLVDDLGIDPGAELAAVHAALLRDDNPSTFVAPALLAGPAPGGQAGEDDGDTSVAAVPPAPPLPVPAQLPPDIPGFTGRGAHLDRLDGLLAGGDPLAAVAPVVLAISGTAGVGKTALAVHWAHRMVDRFPDGTLYINLRGYDPGGQVTEPTEAVRRFLDALGIPAQRIPADLDAQSALYRTVVAGRQMLIVLDNARGTAQVRPLLPGAPTCLVLVTSRNQLSGLVAADAAQHISLDLLTPEESGELLSRRLGSDRAAAEPGAVSEIVACCARLPLALAIVAARGAMHRTFALAALARELRDSRGRLDTLTSADGPHTDVRAVFSWSYRALSPPAARLFALLGLHPGPELTVPAAASLAALTLPLARSLLAELAGGSLLVESTPGRYGFHDLLRAYSTELVVHLADPDDRRCAVDRMLDHYLHSADAADQVLTPTRDPLPLRPAQPGTNAEYSTGYQQALEWFTVEHRVLVAVIDQAASTEHDTHTWQLAATLTTFLERRRQWPDQVGVQRAAVAAARRLANLPAQALARRRLARAYIEMGRYDEPRVELHLALDLDAQAGDKAGQAHTHHCLAYLSERRGDCDLALDQTRQALVLYQAAGHRRGEASALNATGWYHAKLGDHHQALVFCREALRLLGELGDRFGQGATWDSIGYAHHHLGQYSEAIACYQEAVTSYSGLGDQYYEALTLVHLGDTYAATGATSAAGTVWRQALATLADLRHPDAGQVRAKLFGIDGRHY